MIKCRTCELNAKYRVKRLFNVIPVKPFYLCEQHKKSYVVFQDMVLMIALLAAIGLFIFSHSRQKTTVVAAVTPEEKTFIELRPPDERDLNNDGRISFYEDQIAVGSSEYDNFLAIGYPFRQILVPPQDTPSIQYYLDLNAFLKATIHSEKSPLIPLFHHPQLMDKFLRQYTMENAVPRLEAVIIAHDDYLAFALLDPTSQIINSICLEPLDEELAAALGKLPRDGQRNKQLDAQRNIKGRRTRR